MSERAMATREVCMNVLTYPRSRTRSLRIDGVLVTTCGIVATIVMTTVMYMLPLLGWAQVDLPTWIARIFTTAPVTVGETGVALHLLIGTMWAWVFAMQIEPEERCGRSVRSCRAASVADDASARRRRALIK